MIKPDRHCHGPRTNRPSWQTLAFPERAFRGPAAGCACPGRGAEAEGERPVLLGAGRHPALPVQEPSCPLRLREPRLDPAQLPLRFEALHRTGRGCLSPAGPRGLELKAVPSGPAVPAYGIRTAQACLCLAWTVFRGLPWLL